MKTVVEEMVCGRKLTLETGRMAKQAGGAVYVQYGETSVLVAACSQAMDFDPGFFPLTIEYRERSYAAGKIPGGFFKREGRPSEKEILTARLIDRPLRPLFPEGLTEEVQVYCLVLSSDDENAPSLLGMIGSSAALMVSDIPWDGPVSSVRVGRVNGEIVVNPTESLMLESDLELVVACRGDEVVMLEGSGRELPEAVIAEAIQAGAREAAKINRLQQRLREVSGKEKRRVQATPLPEGLYERVYEVVAGEIGKVYGHGGKDDMISAMGRAREILKDPEGSFHAEAEEKGWLELVPRAAEKAEKEYYRQRLLGDGVRYDGRGKTDIRNITCEISVLPRTHGSALFSRGETQALVTATLGGARDEQRVDALMGEYFKSFMLHYNFPSFSVGEVRPVRGPGRREIGHGHLAETAIKPMIPEDFNYTVRVVSDILESNGSSSQATVCGASLCLMDAGVPLAGHVAGVALGLVTDGKKSLVLSDIAGAEDHLGDMDLKIAGTRKGVTAIQMDLKVEGVTQELLADAFRQARDNRHHILGLMEECIAGPREDLSPYAPRIITIQIDRDKIGKLIGPGGKNIRAITEESGAEINISDDGVVTILTNDGNKAKKAVKLVEASVGVPKEGKIYEGTVSSIQAFGAFVEIMPGVDGLLHVSQISDKRVTDVKNVLRRGQQIRVKVTKVREDGKIDLTMRNLEEGSAQEEEV